MDPTRLKDAIAAREIAQEEAETAHQAWRDKLVALREAQAAESEAQEAFLIASGVKDKVDE